jgi:hypothetical protein
MLEGASTMTMPKDPIKAAAVKERIRQARLGTHHTDATKQKMGDSRKGVKNPNYGGNPELSERCRELSKARVGSKASEETKKKMRSSQKRRYEIRPELIDILREKLSGENNPNYGKHIPPEQKVKLSAAKTGERHWIYGTHRSDETKEKIRIANSGENCYHYGQSPSLETRMKMSESQKGDKCYNWKGGITALNHAIRTCLQNREWILSVFKRDNFTCQKCGATKVYLHAHHIRLFADILRENNITTLEEAISCIALWDINNGISYCEECHKEEHFGVADTDEIESMEVAEA